MGGRGLIDARARAGAPGQHGLGGCARTACAAWARANGAGGAPARLGPCHSSAGVRGGGDVVGAHLLLGHVHLAHVRAVHPRPRAPVDRPPDGRGRGASVGRPAVARAPVHVRPLAGRRRRRGRRLERGRVRAGIRDARGAAPAARSRSRRRAARARRAPWCSASCSPRRAPRAIAYPLFVGLLWIVLTQSDRTWLRRAALILPLLVLWANVHGSVLLGVAMVVACCGRSAVASLRRKAWRPAGGEVALSVLAAACVFATPYGTAMIGYYVRVLGDPALATIAEWQPSTFGPLNLPFVVILMGTLGVVCFARGKGVRLPADMMLLAVVLGALAAHAVRYQTWFALGVAPLLALAVTRTWSRRGGLAPPPRVIVIAAGALLLVVHRGRGRDPRAHPVVGVRQVDLGLRRALRRPVRRRSIRRPGSWPTMSPAPRCSGATRAWRAGSGSTLAPRSTSRRSSWRSPGSCWRPARPGPRPPGPTRWSRSRARCIPALCKALAQALRLADPHSPQRRHGRRPQLSRRPERPQPVAEVARRRRDAGSRWPPPRIAARPRPRPAPRARAGRGASDTEAHREEAGVLRGGAPARGPERPRPVEHEVARRRRDECERERDRVGQSPAGTAGTGRCSRHSPTRRRCSSGQTQARHRPPITERIQVSTPWWCR